MQRLFSTFPGGAPGCGLFLLRAATGVGAMTQGFGSLSGPAERTALIWVAGLIAIVSGVLLVVGLLTPVAGLFAALTSAALTVESSRLSLTVLGDPISLFFLVVVALAIVLLGPGAYSFDAYLFGRREIVIPDPHSRK